MLASLIAHVQSGQPLDRGQVAEAVCSLTGEAASAEDKARFLTALALKGETVDEIAAFATELRDRSIQPPIDPATRTQGILDVCGTGGDRLNTFNISTTVAIVASADDIAVAKHGNRAITSRSGSADVLEALGIPVELNPEDAARLLRERHFAFFYAPKYHPSFKQIGPARKLCADRGQRTLFNYLGPLLNPARPSSQLVGVPRPVLCEPLGRVLQSLGVARGMVVCGMVSHGEGATEPGTQSVWLDELSTLGDNTIAEFYQDHGFTLSMLAPGHFPIQHATLADLEGGDAKVNAGIIRKLLAGEDRGPRRDAVLLNTAAGLFLAGRVRSLTEGWARAAEIIDSGRAARQLQRLSVRAS